MKHKLQNLLKHNWRTLLLLCTLITTSQGALATDYWIRGTMNGWGSTKMPGGSLSLDLTGGTNYEFKITTADNTWDNDKVYGKNNTNPSCGASVALTKPGSNLSFTPSKTGQYTISFNGTNLTITCPATTYYVAGNGSGHSDGWCNNKDWNPAGSEMSGSTASIKFSNIAISDNLQFKVTIGSWDTSYGYSDYSSSKSTLSSHTTVSESSGNIKIQITTNPHDITIYYDGSNVYIKTEEISSCTTPTISAVTPSSAQTKSLPTGSATPSVAQAVSATYTGGNQKGWTVTPSTISGYTAATFDNAASASTNLNMKYEGEYTATFGAGCGNTSDATRTTAKITVNPSEIYLAGPLLDGSGVWATNHKMTKSGSTFTYEWTAARTSGQFTLRTSTSADQAGYIIPNYAKNNYTGITAANSGNHNLSVSGVSFAVGERVKVTATYVGWNSTEGKPEYNISFTKVCSNPTAQTVSGTATICTGSSTNVTVASSQSGYTYKLYKGGSLNFPVSEAGTYTVHAYYTSGSDAYCKADMTGSATVTVDATSVAGTISGHSSSQCLGNTRTLTLKNYTGTIQWHVGNAGDFTPSSSTAISGATSEKYYAPISEVGTKYYKAVVTNGVCPAATTTTAADITVNRQYQASDFNLSGNTQYYDGDPKPVTVAEKSGAGNGAITIKYAGSTTAPTNAGTYAITINVDKSTTSPYYCPASDLSVGTLTINKANQITLTISNTATDLVYCDAANVKLTTSGGSGDGAVTYSVTSGSGSVDGDVLSPSAKGSVSVTATKAASQNYNATTSVAKTFNFNIDAPDVYTLSNVGETTTICGDPSSGAGSGTLRLSGSQTGYKYQLYSNGAPIEGYAAKAGTTGSSIDFPVTSSGTYTVYAYYGDNSTNCPTRMDGEITLTISTQPRLVRSAASVTQYMPVTITSVSTDIAEWKIVDGSGNDVSSSTAYLFDQTYDAISFKGASTNGSTAKTYTIQATTAGGCSATTTITVNPDTESCGG